MRRRLIFTLILLIIAAVPLAIFLASSAIRSAPIPEGTPNGDLAFSGNASGDWDIFRLDADGTLHNLTADDSGTQDYLPSWALDGEGINFLSNRMNPTELGPAQVSPEGGEPRALNVVQAIFTLVQEGRFDWDPAWSPDGERLLWASLRDLNLELYVLEDGAGGIDEALRLTEGGARDWFAAWSPDGAQIAYANDGGGQESLYLLASTGGERQVLLEAPPWDAIHPMWTLEGDSMAYVYDLEDALAGGDVLVYTINPDGTESAPLAADVVWRGDPVWSPDGTQIAYVSNETGRWQVYVMDADGENVRRVTPDDGDYLFPVWRP